MVLCGHGRSGKSSLYKSIARERAVDVKSTIGIEANVLKMNNMTMGGGKWGSYSARPNMTADACAKMIGEKKKVLTNDLAPTIAVSQSAVNIHANAPKSHPNMLRSAVCSASSSSLDTPTSALQVSVPTPATVTIDKQMVKEYLQQDEANANEGSVTVTFLDLGGQEVFFPIHVFFMTPSGFFIIVFNMEHLLPSALPETKKEALDYIRRWINAVVVSHFKYETLV